MRIFIDNRSGQDLPLSKIEPLAAFVLDVEGMPDNTELSVSFVDIDEIQSLNLLYRDCDSATDVLSFEMDLPWEEKDTTGFAPDDTRTDDEQLLIGDVVINPDMARKNTVLDEVSFEEELWLLLIHGILHLVGYDHEDDEDRELMEEKEDELFIEWLRRTEDQELKAAYLERSLAGPDTRESGI